MNILLWILQGLTALLYTASGVIKIFLFDKISKDAPSFGAMPRGIWGFLGVVELACVVGLIAAGLLHRQGMWTVRAAIILALESLVFIAVHVKYREGSAVIMSAVLGLIMVFIAYGRFVLSPLV